MLYERKHLDVWFFSWFILLLLLFGSVRWFSCLFFIYIFMHFVMHLLSRRCDILYIIPLVFFFIIIIFPLCHLCAFKCVMYECFRWHKTFLSTLRMMLQDDVLHLSGAMEIGKKVCAMPFDNRIILIMKQIYFWQTHFLQMSLSSSPKKSLQRQNRNNDDNSTILNISSYK